MKLTSNINILKTAAGKLYRVLSGKLKFYGLILIGLTIGFSFIETLGISVIMPFISVASNPALIDSGWYKKAFDFFGFTNAESFTVTLGVVIICFYFFRAVYSIVLNYITYLYSMSICMNLSNIIFKSSLSVPYKVYAQKNSADIMRSVTAETRGVRTIVLNILQMGAELFTVMLIYILMVVLNWKMTLAVTAILSVIVICLLHIVMRWSKTQGEKRAEANKEIFRTLQETFGNFKFVKLKGNKETILHRFGESTAVFSRAEIISSILGIAPKNILESLGFSLLVASVIFIVWLYHDAQRIIPIISMYALALYRILPSIHKIIGNMNNIAYVQKALDIVYEDINQPVEKEGTAVIGFNRSIRIDSVSFNYENGPVILNAISLEIRKGEKIAITGESGSGKSTLVDLVIGIHRPVTGTIFIDDEPLTEENIRSWRSKIGYIPQSIYLFDGTVAENVTFGSVPDEERVKQVLQKANIWEFLATKEGIHTLVGEGGIQLSGGQQQRIGIARALYDDPDILVLDEATSALDSETEMKIMDEIYNVSAQKTLIVIAHRLSTVERCDRKIQIKKGSIIL